MIDCTDQQNEGDKTQKGRVNWPVQFLVEMLVVKWDLIVSETSSAPVVEKKRGSL